MVRSFLFPIVMLITCGDARFHFEWKPREDRAELSTAAGRNLIWRGSLLPVFWLSHDQSAGTAVKATLDRDGCRVESGRAYLDLSLGTWGRARLEVDFGADFFRLTSFEVSWLRPGIAVISIHWGSDILTADERAGAPSLSQPFWPTWRAEGFGVAGAKTSPMQSFFRSWDFGSANIPLGSFGPAMGTPYGAAFPRPTYCASMGGQHGWVCLGAGAIPDAALTLQVRARSATFEWLMREDLWGGAALSETGLIRSWAHPLWLSWAGSSWDAHLGYFRLFPTATGGADSALHQKSFWGTWGDFRREHYNLPQAIDRAVDQMGADVLCIDDRWEEKKGRGRLHVGRFPTFARDLDYAHSRKIGVGIWMPIGWLEDPAAEGLSAEDLLLTADGVPIRSNWATDPREEGPSFYCLDPSSGRSQAFLRERTQRIMRQYRPSLLKIDFTYGIPGPDGCSPRDPSLRGERLAWTYAQIVGEAARAIDPHVTIFSYSLSPLWDDVQDECALDDLGDAGAYESAGHGQWSVWASLMGDRGRAVIASSGYHWSSEADNLLNTAIIGAAGANLPSRLEDGSALPPSRLARRSGLFRWHRRTTRWTPLWLDSVKGDLTQEPTPKNWGRLEPEASGWVLTALALRAVSPEAMAEPLLEGLRWDGQWAVIAQGSGSIFTAATAVVPLSAGRLALPRRSKPARVLVSRVAQPDTEADWRWAEGNVHLAVDAAAASSELIGFTVIS